MQLGVDGISTTLLTLGFEGEQNHTQVVIYWTALYEQYPSATATMVIKPPTGDAYPKVITQDENRILWDVSAADTSIPGSGSYQLTFTDGDEIIKTFIGSYRVLNSITGSGEAPDPVTDWVNEANEVLASIPNTINEAVDNALEEAKESGDFKGDPGEPGAKGDKGDPGDPAPAEEVAEAVDAYLEENFSNPSNPPLDRSLTSALSAAPADLVGDLKNAITSIENCEPKTFFHQSVSGTTLVTINTSIPAGTYTVTWDGITSEDTSATYNSVWFVYSSSGKLNEGFYRTGGTKDLTFASDVVSLYFYASTNSTASQGKAFTFSNFKISGDYELKAKIDGIEDDIEEIETALESKLSSVVTSDIVDEAVTIPKTDFIKQGHGFNLLDYTTMVTDLSWCTGSNPVIGGAVIIQTNQYTGAYTAVKIEVPETASYISIISSKTGMIYSYYFTDGDSKCLSYESNVSYTVSSGKTLNVPTGAVYLYITFKNHHDCSDTMISATETTMEFEPYETYYYIERLKVDSESEQTATLELPDKYELVIGDTFELFYKGIVKATNIEAFDVVVTCNKGSAYERKYVYTPASGDTGTVSMRVDLYDANHNRIDSKSVNLVVKTKASSPESEKNILYVTDSLGNGGFAPGEFKRRLVGSDGTPAGDELSNINFIGTVHGNDCDYEGYGGWNWNSYNTANASNAYMWITVSSHDKTSADQHSVYKDSNNKEWKIETIDTTQIKIIRVSSSGSLPSSGTLTWVSGGEHTTAIAYTASQQAAGNPFWDESEGKVDFSVYATRLSVSSIDYVYVLLGWNSASTEESALKESVRTFIDNVLTSFPSCKIVLLGLEVPARDGLAKNYGASGMANYYDMLDFVFKLQSWYIDITKESSYTGKVSYVNISGQFDTQYNMPTLTQKANTRSSTDVSIQSNGIHPYTPGYYQIADACWRDFHHKLQE